MTIDWVVSVLLGVFENLLVIRSFTLCLCFWEFTVDKIFWEYYEVFLVWDLNGGLVNDRMANIYTYCVPLTSQNIFV
jgi:hypothetical protein